MKKKTLRKDIKKCFKRSKGRFISILCLVALGSFALVGLQVAGPDMRKTGENYFNKYKSADISVIGDYGIDEENRKAINKVTGADKIEYGYLKDAVIADTEDSIRVFSETDGISEYEIVDGRMPQTEDEIAVSSFFSDRYKPGDSIKLSEKADISGNKVLKNHEPKIVGFVNSCELLSAINMGQSTAGTGELQGYAVVTKQAFDSSVYMIARISYTDTEGVDPYSDEYTKLIEAHKDELDGLLADQPALRLDSVKREYQKKIDDAQDEINDAKKELADAKDKLTSGDKQLAEAKQKYKNGQAEYQKSKADAESRLAAAKQKLSTAAGKIAQAESTLKSKRAELSSAESALKNARKTLDTKQSEYRQKAEQFEKLKQSGEELSAAEKELSGKISEAEKQTGMTFAEIKAALPMLEGAIPKEQYSQLCELVEAEKAITQKRAEYDAAAKEAEGAEKQLAEAKAALKKGESEYAAKQKEIATAKQKLSAAEKELAQKKAEYKSGVNSYNQSKQSAKAKLAAAENDLKKAEAEIEKSQRKLDDAHKKYDEKKPDADRDIADAEQKVEEAQDTLNKLKSPVYALDTRREVPGSEGYRIYANVSNIIDSLADVFPIFLYFVAALVTLTTMTRFVDEERINSGTLKALGYANRDIIKKFTVYGLTASMSGAVIGIAAGHLLLPLIVYNAYGHSFTYPQIERHFYPAISLTALALAVICAVLPAFVVASRELKEKPAALLGPKPPQAGSKILLEHIRPLWSRMSFTQKVTARNLFRYKKRMLMTVFGVCGSVTLIFAGFSVQHSISGIKDRQFGDILRYDLIVAQNDSVTDKQEGEIDKLLDSSDIDSHMPIHYEAVTKIAGKSRDKQEIKLIVPQDGDEISKYIALMNRSNGSEIKLSDESCVISERLAKLLNVGVGDEFELTDSENQTHTVKVGGITEMYMGHFIFMNGDYYEKAFAKEYSQNAELVTLCDRSTDNAKLQASKFMEPYGVKGVVQNTTLTGQIDTIVQSLNRIMDILILVAMLLAVVILYNLNNINVSERIRELSTIKVLGFYNKEVTLYIYRETIILTIIGILTGYCLGDALFRYIISVVPPDEVMFNPSLGAKAFVIPLVVISLITLVLGLTVNRRLKRVDMLEALKSVE